MFRDGDTVVAKPSFLIRCNIPIEKRRLTLKDYNGDYSKFMFNDEILFTGQGLITHKNFYLPNSINYEVSKLIEDENIEFVSFSGTTIEGKVIQINSTQHL